MSGRLEILPTSGLGNSSSETECETTRLKLWRRVPMVHVTERTDRARRAHTEPC